MKLYKLNTINFETFFGTRDEPIERDIIIIAQTPSCNAFLLLSKDIQDGVELLNTTPSGFDFTYCQAWGLIVNDEVVDRVIIDLRKKGYGTIEDQLDTQYWDIVNSTNNWKTAIDNVKTKYPKR
jgi:hypothetical protein|tara:strand:- start:177 stop:548 length:372 start_codon:yes stop_codon:yes gene_type:complete